MKKRSSNTNVSVILVGPPADGFPRRCKALLSDKRVNFTPCPDVYAAVACLARKPAGLLIVGRLAELGREGGRFFELAARYGHRCCCLANNKSTHLPPSPHMAIASDIPQLLKTIQGLLAPPQPQKTPRKTEFDKDKFKATDAELKALLGT